MHSITISIPSLSRGGMIVLLLFTAAIVFVLLGLWRGRDSKFVGNHIPLPDFKGCGPMFIGGILGVIAIAVWIGRLLK
jgi:hypothetical protein